MDEKELPAGSDLLRLEYIPLSRAALWDKNPKLHDIGSLATSIARYGYKDPAKFEPTLNDGAGGIVEGNGRVETLRMMQQQRQPVPRGIDVVADTGEWAVPVLFGVDAASKVVAEAYATDHNNLVLSGGNATAFDMAQLWDPERYMGLLTELAEAGELPESVGGDDLDALLAGLVEQEPGEDPGVQINKGQELAEKYGTETGQIWQLGEHRLVIGDCTEPAVVKAVMHNTRAGAVITDPPYGINREGIPNDDPEGLRELFDGVLAVMPITDAVIVAFQSPRLFPVWLDAVRRAGHKFERMLWMYKPNDETYPWRGWLQKSEAILVSSMGKPKWLEVNPYAHDCYSPTTLGRELPKEWGKAHASVKPIVVVSDLVARIAGDVYDPFLGSGTTLIAAHQLRRRCYGVEISPTSVAVAIQRWVDLTDLEPRLIQP